MPPYNKYRGRPRGGSYNPLGKPYTRPTPTEPCAIYTRTGRCDSGRNCRYAHIPERKALCMSIFKTGKCSKAGAERCFLNHKASPQNTPMCEYFSNGHCTNGEDCKYMHMTNLDKPVNGKRTPVCRSFALNGWCDRGKLCNKRHSFDCPDFEAHGKCVNTNCTLQHVIFDTDHVSVPQPTVANSIDRQIKVGAFVEFIDSLIKDPQKANEIYNPNSSQLLSGQDYFDEDNSTSEDDSDSSEGSEGGGMGYEWAEEDEEIDVNADFIKV